MATVEFWALTIAKRVMYYAFKRSLNSYTQTLPGTIMDAINKSGAMGGLSYADLTTFLLFKYIGTAYDPTNPFCYLMFFVVPALRIVEDYVGFIQTYWSRFANEITNATSKSDRKEPIQAAFLAVILGFVYNMGQLMIAANTYYSPIHFF